ncbi:MAG: phage shock protein PspA [Verrucomicrobiota bacterium]
MGIFTRFCDIVNSNINAMLEQAEDPDKMIRLMVQEMEETLIEIKASCAGAIAARKKSSRTLEELQNSAEGWESKARLAVEKGREELAREALIEKRRAVAGVQSMSKEVNELDAIVGKYQADICQLEEKLAGAREKQRVLVHRHIHANQKSRAQEQIRRVNTNATLLRFEQFEQRIDRMEAAADLVNYGQKQSLEEKFAALEREADIEKELKALQERVATGAKSDR